MSSNSLSKPFPPLADYNLTGSDDTSGTQLGPLVTSGQVWSASVTRLRVFTKTILILTCNKLLYDSSNAL